VDFDVDELSAAREHVLRATNMFVTNLFLTNMFVTLMV
jgi:hypothetical protein